MTSWPLRLAVSSAQFDDFIEDPIAGKPPRVSTVPRATGRKLGVSQLINCLLQGPHTLFNLHQCHGSPALKMVGMALLVNSGEGSEGVPRNHWLSSLPNRLELCGKILGMDATTFRLILSGQIGRGVLGPGQL